MTSAHDAGVARCESCHIRLKPIDIAAGRCPACTRRRPPMTEPRDELAAILRDAQLASFLKTMGDGYPSLIVRDNDEAAQIAVDAIIAAGWHPEASGARCRQCGGPLSDARAALGLTLCSGPCHKAANQVSQCQCQCGGNIHSPDDDDD